jgi:hypothetical protein
MGEVVLCNTSDANEVLRDLRKAWVYDLLSALGIEADDTTDQIEARGVLSGLGIRIDLRSNGEEIDVYKCEWRGSEDSGGWLPPQKKHLIAQWKRPKYVRRVDGKDLYYELHLDKWSMVSVK